MFERHDIGQTPSSFERYLFFFENIIDSSTKACYPGIASQDLTDAAEDDERSIAKSLPSCVDCSLFNNER